MEFIVKTILQDEEYLRQISKEVDLQDKSYLSDIEVLKLFCKDNGVLAMASVQLGIPKRIIYLKNTDVHNLLDRSINEERIMINPVIVSMRGLTKYWETCASCLDNMGLVKRPYEVVVKYQDIEGNQKEDKLEGFESTVFCHEFDHLNGILHLDKAKEILNMPREERKIFRETHGYEVISKDCVFREEK